MKVYDKGIVILSYENTMQILKHALLSIITISLGYCVTTQAQTLAEEQTILDKLQVQTQNLNSVTADLTNSLADVKQKITTFKAENTNQALVTAEKELTNAKTEQTANPSSMNTDKLEMANFKYALAFRKYKKNNPELFGYLQQESELNRALETNKAKLESNNKQIEAQTSLVNTLLKEAELSRQAWLAKQANKQVEQDKANKERAEALAKVAQLRALISQQQQKQEQALSKEAQ